MLELGSFPVPGRDRRARSPGATGVASGDVGFCFTRRHGGRSVAQFATLNLSTEVGDEPSAVVANRAWLLDRLGLARMVWLRAEHGARVEVVARSGGGPADELSTAAPGDGTGAPGDGLVTTSPGVGLAAMSADCALIVCADPAAGVVGVAHCGRLGLLAGVVAGSVAAMRAQGASRIVAAVGPSICGACYELPVEMAREVTAAVPAAAHRCQTDAGTGHVDVRAGVVAQLLASDVDVRHLIGSCTREDPASFSYRRDRTTGRMAAVVWLAP